MRFFRLAVTFLVLFTQSIIAYAIQDTNIKVFLEEPFNGDIKTGIGNLRGFAVAPWGIDSVALYIDGVYKYDIPFGGSRKDVCSVYTESQYPDSCYSGFSMAYAFSILSAGNHTIAVVAYDNYGDWNQATSTFEVVRFPNPYISDESKVDIMEAFPAYVDAYHFVIACLYADGNYYDVRLTWDKKKQDWKSDIISNSNLDCPPPAGEASKYWYYPPK